MKRERETGTRKPLGGLLADEMGVGSKFHHDAIGRLMDSFSSTETVEIIGMRFLSDWYYLVLNLLATMIANPPAEGEENRCTLIVAPSGLVNQCKCRFCSHGSLLTRYRDGRAYETLRTWLLQAYF